MCAGMFWGINNDFFISSFFRSKAFKHFCHDIQALGMASYLHFQRFFPTAHLFELNFWTTITFCGLFIFPGYLSPVTIAFSSNNE